MPSVKLSEKAGWLQELLESKGASPESIDALIMFCLRGSHILAQDLPDGRLRLTLGNVSHETVRMAAESRAQLQKGLTEAKESLFLKWCLDWMEKQHVEDL